MNTVILFDIDGTLLLSGGAGWLAMQSAFAELFQRKSLNPVPVHGRTDCAIVADLFEQHQIEDSHDNRSLFFKSYLSHLPQAFDRCDGKLLPGVESLLGELARTPGIQLGLVTGNVEPAAWAKIQYFGIDGFFEFGGFGGDDKHRNQVAEKAVAAARNQSERIGQHTSVTVIGDTLADLECARWINAHAVGVLTGGCDRHQMLAANPDLLLDDFADTDRALAELLSLANAGREASSRASRPTP